MVFNKLLLLSILVWPADLNIVSSVAHVVLDSTVLEFDKTLNPFFFCVGPATWNGLPIDLRHL